MRFEIQSNPYDQSKPLYPRDFIIIHPGLTFIVGCNGSGKSTFLDIIEKACKEYETPIEVFRYVYEEGNRPADQSEGEREAEKLHEFLNNIHEHILEANKGTQMFVLADLTRYGLTNDEIALVKEKIAIKMIPDAQSRGVEFFGIITANDFEYLLDQECMDVQTFNHLRFNNYTSYKKFMVNSRKARESRYKKMKS